LVSVHNQIVFSLGTDRNSCGQAAPLGACPPARGQAAFVRHAAGDVTAAVGGSCCCFEGSGTGGTRREREARVVRGKASATSRRRTLGGGGGGGGGGGSKGGMILIPRRVAHLWASNTGMMKRDESTTRCPQREESA
jgi:hypothetical protein